MAVHLYGVLDAGADPTPSIPGLDGRVVRVLALGDRCAWVSDVAESRLEATPPRIRAHDAVLSGAIAQGYSVVPSLFGRLHADDAALIAGLEGSAAALDAAMALVRERVEMSIIVAPSGAAPAAKPEHQRESRGPGHAHLQRIRNQVHAERILRGSAAELALSATRALTDLYIAERVVEEPAPPVLVARAHLVARDSVARYLRAVKLEAAGSDPALRVAVRGPGAAYSFAAVQIG
jgi:hypothetical protein